MLVRIVAAFVGLTALGFLLNVASGLRYTRVSAEILFDMRLDLYRHLQRLSPRFYARTRMGDIVSRLNNDIGEIQRVAAEAALAWIGNLLFLAGAVGMMIWLDVRLFLAGLAVLPLSIWALVLYRRASSAASRYSASGAPTSGAFSSRRSRPCGWSSRRTRRTASRTVPGPQPVVHRRADGDAARDLPGGRHARRDPLGRHGRRLPVWRVPLPRRDAQPRDARRVHDLPDAPDGRCRR